jgi:hypothetical protein
MMEQQALYPVFAYGKWGLVNREGDQMVPIKYDRVMSLDDGVITHEGYDDQGDSIEYYIAPIANAWFLQTGYEDTVVDSYGREIPFSRVEGDGGEDEEDEEKTFPPDWEGIVERSKRRNLLVPRWNIDWLGEEGDAAMQAIQDKWGYEYYLREDYCKLHAMGLIREPDYLFDFPQFSEGLVPCYDTETELYGYMNRKGEVVIEPQWDVVFPFDKGYATVGNYGEARDRQCGPIDKQGNIEHVDPFKKNGWVIVHNGAKHGVIDKDSHFIIPPRYNSISRFKDGLAWATKDNKWGYIDLQGNEVLPVEQDFDYAFWGNKIMQRDGTWCDISGDRGVPPDYGDIEVHFEKWKPFITNRHGEKSKEMIYIQLISMEWAYGNEAYFDLKLAPDTTLYMKWGDGKEEPFTNHNCHTDSDWLRVRHRYPTMAGMEYTISIEALTGSIQGIMNWSIDMRRKGIDTSQCPSLEYLTSTYTEALDVSKNRLLKRLDITGCDAIHALDLTQCDKLEILMCRFCTNLKQIAISNHSSLIEIEHKATPIRAKSLDFILKTIEKNL